MIVNGPLILEHPKKKKRDIKKMSYSYSALAWCVGVSETDMLLSALSDSDLQNLNLPQTQLPAEQPDSCSEHRALTASSRIHWPWEGEE